MNVRLSLRKQTIRELDAEDVIDVAGGDTTACCVGCSTCGTATWCEKLRLNTTDIAARIRERKCSQTGNRLVEEFRTDDGSVAAFAEGFVSAAMCLCLAAAFFSCCAGASFQLA